MKMNSFTELANNILIAVDNRDLIDSAKLKQTLKALNRFFVNGEAKVTLCTTIDLEPTVVGENHIADQLYQLRRNVVEQSLTECGSCFDSNVQVSTSVLSGRVFVATIHQLVRGQHDALVYIRYHGKVGGGLSSTEMHLARKCPGPVLFFDAQKADTLKNIVVAVDRDIYGRDNASALAQDLIKTATKMADLQGSDLHIVHAWEPFGVDLLGDPRHGFENDDIENYCAEQRASHDIWLKELTASSAEPLTAKDITTTLHLRQGSPEDVVLDVCDKVSADLLVVGTVGITDVPGVLIGNTAETILGNAPCSMLTLKPSGFISPVEAS